jgi:hypothetical protein
MPRRSKRSKLAIQRERTVKKPSLLKNKWTELQSKGYIKIRTNRIHHHKFSEVKKLLTNIESRVFQLD